MKLQKTACLVIVCALSTNYATAADMRENDFTHAFLVQTKSKKSVIVVAVDSTEQTCTIKDLREAIAREAFAANIYLPLENIQVLIKGTEYPDEQLICCIKNYAIRRSSIKAIMMNVIRLPETTTQAAYAALFENPENHSVAEKIKRATEKSSS
jgi:hypothetical protein